MVCPRALCTPSAFLNAVFSACELFEVVSSFPGWLESALFAEVWLGTTEEIRGRSLGSLRVTPGWVHTAVSALGHSWERSADSAHSMPSRWRLGLGSSAELAAQLRSSGRRLFRDLKSLRETILWSCWGELQG